MTVRLEAPASKSMTQRALVIAALCDAPTRIVGPLRCDDSLALITALRAFGCGIDVGDDGFDVRPEPLRTPTPPLELGNAGTATRFAACLSLLCDGPLVIDGDEAMRRRPIGPLGVALAALGVQVSYLGQAGCPPVRLTRRATPPRRATIEGSQSSQFASGLAMVAPRLDQGLVVELEGDLVSLPYLDMTLAMMGQAGAVAERQGRQLAIAGGGYARPRVITIERDWSAAAYLLTAARLTGQKVAIAGLTPPDESLQGDSAIVALLDQLAQGQTVFDLTHTPDLIGPLTAASLGGGQAVQIRGAAHTRAKECDRVAVLCRELGKLGATLTAHDDGLDVTPLTAAPAGPVVLDPAGDHRMAMTFGVLALRYPAIEVANPKCVSKSFPAFWDVIARLSAAPSRSRAR